MLGATVTDVGPVIVSASFPDRGGGRFVVSESWAGSGGKAVEVFVCRELLRDLCRGFVPMCGPGGSIQSPATLGQSVRALLHPARAVDEKAGSKASSLRLADFSIDHLVAMESRLLRDHPGRRTASATSRCVARLLVSIEEEWPGRCPSGGSHPHPILSIARPTVLAPGNRSARSSWTSCDGFA